jgi:hypothetical protein
MATVNLGARYQWIALSNTALGMLIATINSSIVLIALPEFFFIKSIFFIKGMGTVQKTCRTVS